MAKPVRPHGTPHEIASARSAHVYARLEPGADGTACTAYLALRAAVSEICSEAMHEIGAANAAGELDPAAKDLFGELDPVMIGISEEIAEHVYTATRRYVAGRQTAS